ncbi:ribose-phosphate pyrophosphokinase [Sediminibacillus halophilus]|uniref:Ribose-phosphate pyrophosphokinase n=2 Tax=Sediminibacillus halophilus TaxID=482461 RepID=A0A1G9RW61_9BACI|nr:ribose-phosphate pyrophosphokinase [Sediminibacillus halophilus]
MSRDFQESKMKVFSLSSNLPLAEEIADNMGVELGKSTVTTFSDGEVRISIEESVRGYDVFVIQSTSEPVNQHILELLIMIDTLKRASAKTINIFIPYYGYARQDRKARPREPITAKLVADLIQEAGASRVISLDLHAPQIQGFFNIPVDQLAGIPILASYLQEKQLEDVVVVSPDHGSVSRARQLADHLKAPIAIIDKRGPRETEVGESNIVGNIAGKTAVLVDDIVDTGTRMTSGTKALMAKGAKEVYACCTHPVLSGIAIDKINNSDLKELIVTNSIPIPEEKHLERITQLSVAPLMSDAITRVFEDRSVSPLFD